MSCMEPVRDGARISISDSEAVEFRAGVIEWLMTNHPHDCAICDEGGSCHLQDMRSEEHTSELQSLMRISYAVFCLKKKHKIIINITHVTRRLKITKHSSHRNA